MKKFLLTMIVLLGASGAWAADFPVLPDPNTVIGTNGANQPEKIATQYDDFYNYVVGLNDFYQPDAGWDKVNSGTGGLDLLLYTGAGTHDRNQDVGAGDAFNFEDPMSAPSGNTTSFTGSWGIGNQPNGPVTVDALYTYLTTTFGPNVTIPIFYFDMNQQGGDPDLFVAGKVSIIDPNNSNAEIAFWAFDNTTDGGLIDGTKFGPNPADGGTFNTPTDFNPVPPGDASWVYAPGNLVLGGDFPLIDENRGSGHPDFIDYAPTMDLSQYLGKGYLFRADFYLTGLNNGFEELYLTGLFSPQCTTNCQPVIPEPTSMLLLGSGLLGMVGFRKKKIS